MRDKPRMIWTNGSGEACLVQGPALPAPLAHQEDPEPLLGALSLTTGHGAAGPVSPGGPQAEQAGGQAEVGGAGLQETSPTPDLTTHG